MTTTTERICALNDELRSRVGDAELPDTLGFVCITRSVSEHGSEFVRQVLHAVRQFSDFTPNNDPYGEHDFGTFLIDDEQLNWKIDYYDLNQKGMGSVHPEDADATRRVLTIMLAEDY